MKKTLLLAVCMIFAALSAMAGKITVEEGDKGILKEDATATFKIDYTNAKWADKGDFKTWSGKDYDSRVKKNTEGFIAAFNKNAKLKLQESGDAKYSITFHAGDLDRKQKATGMWGQFCTSVSGTMEVVDNATGNVVLKLNVNDIRGSVDFDYTDSITKGYVQVAKELNKLK